MSTLSSSSTLAQVQASYDDNASYEEDNSAVKARAFVTACRILIRMIPKRSVMGGSGGEEIEMTPDLLREEIRAARRWLSSHGGVTAGGAGVKRADFTNFRG